ncbi:hypothetical protein Nepgr_030955 [Nepenthes gracilis]|uniref:Uncharacterized protein n=1 Tax=Nepenthes gracilis TaxID=150966 RepID=A0AAD3Y4C8_NEPGR|nr:hypothetical protein Nepgr_030955 [Nepenthes gracilis]
MPVSLKWRVPFGIPEMDILFSFPGLERSGIVRIDEIEHNVWNGANLPSCLLWLSPFGYPGMVGLFGFQGME